MPGQIAIFEGYGSPSRRRKTRRRKGKLSQTPFAKATRACRKRHPRATKLFWRCVSNVTTRGTRRKRRGASRRRRSRR